MASLPDLPPLATVQRRAKPTRAPSRLTKARTYNAHLEGGSTFRFVVGVATAAFLDRLISGGEVLGGNPAVLRAAAKARAAGVKLAVARVPRTDGGAGHVALYRLAEGTSLEPERGS